MPKNFFLGKFCLGTPFMKTNMRNLETLAITAWKLEPHFLRISDTIWIYGPFVIYTTHKNVYFDSLMTK